MNEPLYLPGEQIRYRFELMGITGEYTSVVLKTEIIDSEPQYRVFRPVLYALVSERDVLGRVVLKEILEPK